MIVIQGSLDFDPDDADKFEAIVLPLQRASASEPGCISYHFSRDLEVPGRFRVAECWESDDALKVHFTTQDMADFRAGMKELRFKGNEIWKHTATERAEHAVTRILDGMDVERVLLAEPRGFCAGVEMAIKALAWMVRAFEPPVYCYHEIVHNKIVVERFRSLGVVFVDDIADVPEGRPIMLSAHGSAPEVVAAARQRGSYVVDSVCPLVTKVHHEVKVRAGKGYQIVYVGHEGHEEAVGTMAVAPGAIHRVESADDVALLPAFDEPVALLAQTTLSHRDWEGVAEAAATRFPQLWRPGRSDLCFATTNRQSALIAMASRCDAIVVIGSANSSNTKALEKLARASGCPSVHRVNGAEELPPDLSGVVGVTAGASAPEELVLDVITRLNPRAGVEVLRVTDEDEYFPPPRQLRELQTAIGSAAAAMSGGAVGAASLDDRAMAASVVLESLRD